ncbi:DUF6090 family protein [Winogradskyella sp. UBA3174]|uniref:DUF6090 family protein n=1 Tax=Winogradskyella sp. UBA3174 TaxID=1947785 RepID=UPI0025F424AA|nr:DUF6090 family protein [Winogradskyella sp. UBA3174]|tara:strand:+ start:28595 stop:29308 length:714 start_codon:yes stop_codon:yes gene_type:complete
MRFFSKSRFQLLRGTQTRKYLTYAIGEIVLVVIGILIALAINDWKQQKGDQSELNRIITVIEADFKSDLKETKNAIKTLNPAQKLIKKMLYRPKFKDSIRNCVDCRYILARSYIINFKSKGQELLSNYNKDLKTKNKYVDSILSFYEIYSKDEFQFKNKLILEEVVNNMEYLRDNYDWYSDYITKGKCEENCLNYFESPNYINRLAYFELFYNDFLLDIEDYKAGLQKTLGFLNNRY